VLHSNRLGKTLSAIKPHLLGEKMGILDKAKELSGKVSESVTEFSSDDVIANTIIKAVEKQEKVNNLLKEKGSNYRVSDIQLEMGIPPTISFSIRRGDDKTESPSPGTEPKNGAIE
jgi:hypothetical protein